MKIQTKKFAVLIDADNSSIHAIFYVLEEVAKYGIASVKRVYGDWSSESLKNGEMSYFLMRLRQCSNLLKPPEMKISSNIIKDNLNIPDSIDRSTLNLIYKAVKDNTNENGWANLSMVGKYISAVKPDFDSRNYGRAKLSGLIKTLNLFETKVEMSQMYLKKMKK